MFEFCINDHRYSKIHFIGIGGISMSGLAKILLNNGYEVSGSDRKDDEIIKMLKEKGATVYKGHSKDNIKDSDLVIYTDAIPKDNEEFLEALNKKIPTVDRATFLGALIRNYTDSIAVSGTHGKTSTTSMIATILDAYKEMDPTILLGGSLDQIGGNVKIGNNNDLLLTEACEYKGNVLKYYPSIAIILNMEEDHMDYFKDIDHIVDTFIGYTRNIQENGHLILNIDDPHAEKVIKETDSSIVTFAIDREADYRAENVTFDAIGLASFDLNVKDLGVFPVNLKVMGLHNISNALASIAATHTLGIPIETIISAMENYSGTHRRLEFKGTINDLVIMDDYAHHPTEIKATLNALDKTDSKIWCIFQPHTYSRTIALLNDFSNAFEKANKVIITDIYAARESDNGDVHSKDLVEKLLSNKVDAIYIKDFFDIEEYIIKHAKGDDLIVTMGAGDIHEVGENLLKKNIFIDNIETKVM